MVSNGTTCVDVNKCTVGLDTCLWSEIKTQRVAMIMDHMTVQVTKIALTMNSNGLT